MSHASVSLEELKALESSRKAIKNVDFKLGSVVYNYGQSIISPSSAYRRIYRANATEDMKAAEVGLKELMADVSNEYVSIRAEISALLKRYLKLPEECPELVRKEDQLQAMAAYEALIGKYSAEEFSHRNRVEHFRIFLWPDAVKAENINEAVRKIYIACERAYGPDHSLFGSAKGIRYIEKLLEQLEWENALGAFFVVYSQGDEVFHNFNLITTDSPEIEINELFG